MGLRLAARIAGKKPENKPTITDTPVDKTTEPNVTTVGTGKPRPIMSCAKARQAETLSLLPSAMCSSTLRPSRQIAQAHR